MMPRQDVGLFVRRTQRQGHLTIVDMAAMLLRPSLHPC